MVTTGAKSIFLDTNVLVYASIAEAPLHQVARDAIQAYEQAGNSLWISRQVLREYIAVLTCPQSFTESISIKDLLIAVRAFTTRFQVADENLQVTERLIEIMARVTVGGRQVHDANVVATIQPPLEW